MHYAKLFLNKVIDSGDASALARYNIDYRDMHTDIDRRIYRFIEEYAEQNGGRAPSYATVAAEIDGYEYIPDVSDSYEYLARQIKDYSAKQAIIDVHNSGEFERRLNEMPATEFNNWLTNFVDDIKIRTSVRNKTGTDVKKDVDKFLDEYERRKLGESFKVWKSKYSAVGNYIGGNLYTVIGGSGRGKSILTLEDAIYLAKQGANVLIWAMELGWYEVMVRIYTSLSGDSKVRKIHADSLPDIINIEGSIDGGFDAGDMRIGKLEAAQEQKLREFLRNFNEKISGNIIVRAVDDEDFVDRSIRALERDIDEYNIDIAVIDPFYYMDYEKNRGRTTGGDAAETSRKLRSMAGRKGIVAIALTQTSDKSEEDDGDGTRELKPPSRESVTSTKRLLQDASILIGIDSDWRQGAAIVVNLKGRDGGEGEWSNITFLPQYGIIKELETGEEAMKGFDF